MAENGPTACGSPLWKPSSQSVYSNVIYSATPTLVRAWLHAESRGLHECKKIDSLEGNGPRVATVYTLAFKAEVLGRGVGIWPNSFL